MILLFLLTPKYKVFHSTNLHNDEFQHCARLDIFSDFFKMLKFEFCELQK
jgi:hypothetical protein